MRRTALTILAATLATAGCSSSTIHPAAQAVTSMATPSPQPTTTSPPASMTPPKPPTTTQSPTIKPGADKKYADAIGILTVLEAAGIPCANPDFVGEGMTSLSLIDCDGDKPGDTVIAVYATHQLAADDAQGRGDFAAASLIGQNWDLYSTPSYTAKAKIALGGLVLTDTTPTITTVVLQTSGNGIKQTKAFTVGPEWSVRYTFDCSNFGGRGNFIVNQDEYGDVLVNSLAAKGSDTVYRSGHGGTHSLSVNSECQWTVVVTDGDKG